MRRATLMLMMLFAGLLTPLSCAPVVLVVNMFNPSRTAFVADIEVANRSGRTVAITPVGTVGPDGLRAVLPQYTRAFPAIPAFGSGDLLLADGEARRIIYDWEGINFSEIAVRCESGEYLQLVTDPEPTQDQYHAPKVKRYTIGNLADLEPIDEQVQQAVRQRLPAWQMWGILLVCCLPPLVLVWLIRAYRRERRRPAEPTVVDEDEAISEGESDG